MTAARSQVGSQLGSQAEDDALALLTSSPSLLTRLAAYVDTSADAPKVDWSGIAAVAQEGSWSATERAFLGICADIGGHRPEGSDGPDTFGERWEALDGQHQAMIASVLASSAQTKKDAERAVLERLGVTFPDPIREGSRAVRVRLGPDIPAVSGDALGRERVGYRDGLTPAEVWLRGRGVWRMQAARVIDSQLLLIANAGLVRMVGTIDGITLHGERIAILGRPLPEHPLIGSPDPLENGSQNPVAYGDLDNPAPVGSDD
ncbi:MAG TPA: hypothetical protein P5181_06020 [Dermatophilaceae bacterium]|nr:hypothetical protein [Dermatophilaceae bacterium]